MALIGTHICMAISEYIDLESFAIGECVEVHYTAPTKRATVNLLSKNSDTVLHCDYRVKYSNMKDTVLLNTRLANENWNSKTRILVTNTKSTPGTNLEFVICPIADDEFSVAFNGKLLANYDNSKINITSVSRVQFNNNGGDAELQEICVTYS